MKDGEASKGGKNDLQTQKTRTEFMVRRKNGAQFWVELEVVTVQASAEEITDFHRTAAAVCALVGVAPGEGYRAITNAGAHGMQEVPHYHLHILGGRALGPMLSR